MLEELRDDAANGDFHNKWGFRVVVIMGVTGVAWRLTSAAGVVEVLGQQCLPKSNKTQT
jgi:hypothetical protein